ncbi:hypothetical protein SmJEL517_g03185 [Synchytrium microbalum]|uniref:Uncharacterized protein n=1 Tax=Synchytrium microbalum TaxID=1806994 RepID=A0A507BXJ6_9FUNG|nr:uncharacterized protein SmJEL517_g03185 [Synchytrium microbalum]TPX34040.1 hypothetical protein SmJEL517_g03185 [Synchytrium microbalum]
MKVSIITMTLAASLGSALAATDYSKYLTLNAACTASSTDPTSDPNNAVLDGTYETTGATPPGNLPVWKSKISATCENSVDFTVDWTAKYGAVSLSTVRFEWGTRPAGMVTLAAVNAGAATPTTAKLVANATDGYYYLNVESTGSTPMATGAKLTFTQLKAGADGMCYVDLADIDAYPTTSGAAGAGAPATGGTTTGTTAPKSGTTSVVAGYVFAAVAILASGYLL